MISTSLFVLILQSHRTFFRRLEHLTLRMIIFSLISDLWRLGNIVLQYANKDFIHQVLSPMIHDFICLLSFPRLPFAVTHPNYRTLKTSLLTRFATTLPRRRLIRPSSCATIATPWFVMFYLPCWPRVMPHWAQLRQPHPHQPSRRLRGLRCRHHRLPLKKRKALSKLSLTLFLRRMKNCFT